MAAALPILTYHNLRDVEPGYPFDPGVVDASPAEFDEQMAFVARWFVPVGIDEIRSAIRGGPLPRNAIAITFDDGYRSNLELAVPILKRHGLRATFFFATGYLTERKVFWWDRIAYILHETQRERIALSYPYELGFDLRSAAGRSHMLGRVLKLVKTEVGMDVERFMTELAARAAVRWDAALERRLADELLLTWDEVRAVRAAGMDVQSHTKSHRALGTLSIAELRRELIESRVELEHELGEKVHAVSYPCGIALNRDDPFFERVREAGYEIGLASHGGMNHLHESRTHPLRLARISLDYGTPMSYFRGTLALPVLAR